MPDQPHALQFPTQFPIKIIGYNHSDLLTEVLAVINSQFPEITMAELVTRHSKDQKYISITVTVTALSQQQLDEIYQRLSVNDKILMAL